MAFELLLRSGCNDQIGYLGRKETSQSTHTLDFAHLIGYALLKLLVQPIEIIEQSRVLDRYHRLVGKRLDQLDLPIREKSDFPTVQTTAPIGFPSRSIGTASAVRIPRACCIAAWVLFVSAATSAI